MNTRILTVQDISCVGQCSLTVALPILSACGLETAILPSAVLSTHTGGFKGFTFRDLSEDIPAIGRHWQKEGILFDAMYTGYLGSARQVDMVLELYRTVCKPGAPLVVDPAMADNGVLYTGFDDNYVQAMKRLCQKATVLLPNVTEACFLTDTPYLADFSEDFVEELQQKMMQMGCKKGILTGACADPKQTGVSVWEEEGSKKYLHRRVPVGSHGTGDVYASAFMGAWMNGNSLFDSAVIAADFTLDCIENNEKDHWYGVQFEPRLPGLIRRLGF